MPDTTTQSTSGLLTLGTSSPSALTTASINALSTEQTPALSSVPVMSPTGYSAAQRTVDADKETVQVRTSSKAN